MVDRAGQEWIDSWGQDGASRIEARCRDAQAHCYALLDMAFAPDLRQPLFKRVSAPDRSLLYAGKYQGPGLEDLSPVVLRLPDTPEQRAPLLHLLQRHCDGRPMLSLLVSDRPLSWLTAHLRVQMEAVDGNGEAFLLRLADTRALAALFAVFTDAQRARLLNGILRWDYLGRDAQFHTVDGAEVNGTAAAQTDPYRIDASQREALDRLALPDALTFQIRSRPSVFGVLTGQPSQRHACMTQALWACAQEEASHDAIVYRTLVQHLRDDGLLVSKVPSEVTG